MIELHIGDELTYCGGVFRVIGVSPMSASPRRIYLAEVNGGRCVEVDFGEVRREALVTSLTDASPRRGELSRDARP